MSAPFSVNLLFTYVLLYYSLALDVKAAKGHDLKRLTPKAYFKVYTQQV